MAEFIFRWGAEDVERVDAAMFSNKEEVDLPHNFWTPSLVVKDRINKYRAYLKERRDKAGPQKAALDARTIAQKDLFYLAHQVLGFEDVAEPLHSDYCDFLMWAELEGHSTLTLFPRSHYKTSIGTTARITWRILNNPDLAIGLGSATLKDSRPFGRDIRVLWEKSGRLKALFPDIFYQEPKKESEKWTEEEFTVKRTRHRKEATVTLFGLEDDLPTGRHFDRIVLDDAINKDNVRTPERLAKIRDQAQLLPPLLVTLEQPIDWVGTHYHVHDYYMVLKQKQSIRVYQRKAIERGAPIFPQKFNLEALEKLRVEWGNYLFSCTPAEAPILMADWSLKRIADVKAGDKVIGWQMPTEGTPHERRHRMVVAEVKRVHAKEGELQKMVMASGRTIRCTPDHKWYTGRRSNPKTADRNRTSYRPANVGMVLRRITEAFGETTEQERMDWAYLAGLIDGEGACKHGNFALSQCKTANPEICARIEEVLKRLGIEYGYSPNGRAYHLNGGEAVKAKLLRYGRPAKAKNIIEGMLKRSCWMGRHKDRVVSIEPDGRETVYALETTTGNYVAYGYASSNSQYMMEPQDPADKKFKREWLHYYNDPIMPKKPGMVFFMAVDPASRRRKKSDFTAMLVFGVNAKGHLHLVDGVHDKLNPWQRVDAVLRLAKKWSFHTVAYETIGFQESDKFYLEQAMLERKTFFRIVEVAGHKERKDDRIMGIQPFMQAGKFWLPAKGIPYRRLWESPDDGYGHLVDIVEQLHLEFDFFPDSNHDDLLDVCAMARHIIHNGYVPTPDKQEFRMETAYGRPVNKVKFSYLMG